LALTLYSQFLLPFILSFFTHLTHPYFSYSPTLPFLSASPTVQIAFRSQQQICSLPSLQSSLCKQALRSFANILCKMEFVFIGSRKRITSNRSPDEVSEQCHTGAFPISSLYVYYPTVNLLGTADGGTVIKVLRYKSEGRWFDSTWCQWNFPLT
jgi:hypothetical protein